MKGVQEKLDDFSVVGVKPGFMNHEEEGKGSYRNKRILKPK